MSLTECEVDLLKYLREFRLRPSKVSAELFYFTLTTNEWKSIQKTLFEWFDIYSELGDSSLSNYQELLELVTSIRQDDEQRLVEVCRIFYMVKSHDRELLDTDRGRVMRRLASNASPKSLICQMFISLMDDNLIGIFKYAQLAFDKNVSHITLSILASLQKKDIAHFRNKLKEGHDDGVYHCGCNTGKVSQHLRRMSLLAHKMTFGDEDEDKCEVVDIISELENVLDIMQSSSRQLDLTAVYDIHLTSKREDFSRHFYMKHRKSILYEQHVETLIE